MTKRDDLQGQIFGRFTILGFSHVHQRNAYWHVACSCGNKRVVSGNSLKRGLTKSCGCYGREVTGNRRRSHGMSRSREYGAWCKMISRCTNPKDRRFNEWGGRGITVCERWLHSFANFYADMGDKPPRTLLDRIDNDGNYEPGNCRWAMPSESNFNRHKPRRTKALKSWTSLSRSQRFRRMRQLNRQPSPT
jgi:hypothetical protein